MNSLFQRMLIAVTPLAGAALIFFGSATHAQDDKLKAEFEAYKKKHLGEFYDYKKKFEEEFNQYKKLYAEESKKFDKEVATIWDELETSSPKVWVGYSKDLKTKNSVDFEKGVIRISTTVKQGDDQNPDVKAQVKSLLVKDKAQAFQEDKVAKAVEEKSKNMTTVERAQVKPEPILLPYVLDKPKATKKEVDKAVDDLLAKKKQTVTTNKKGEKVVTIEVPLQVAEAVTKTPVNVPATKNEPTAVKTDKKSRPMADLRVNQLPKGARKVSDDVSQFAKRYQLSESLVYAVIETESAFNPMAKSPIPAYGLMQIVPTSAGVDATELIYGKPRILAPSYLYTSDKNIEVGAAYLHILYTRYLRKIENPLSRLYCSIAAYNTGAGNVAKAFTGNRKLGKAVPIINQKTPEEVYLHLVKNLPYDETRKYLKKVVSRMPKYAPQG